jgi:hypothetical protein
MTIDGSTAHDPHDLELQDMVSREESEQSGPHAPLLASADTSPDHDDEVLASELNYSGGWFIWILTFSAGISGLLFGYEYVASPTVIM